MTDRTTRTPISKCPSCGTPNDAATLAGKGDEATRPDPGDVSVCLYCGHLMAFAEDLTLRDLTDAEMHEVAGDPRILAVQKARGMAMRKGKP